MIFIGYYKATKKILVKLWRSFIRYFVDIIHNVNYALRQDKHNVWEGEMRGKINAIDIIPRMIKACGLKTSSELAEKIGMSPQSLTNIKARQSVSLKILLDVAEMSEKLTGKRASIDYLVGLEDETTEELHAGHYEIRKIGGGTIQFPEGLIETKEAEKLRALSQRGKLYIIDGSDVTLNEGLFALGDTNRPVVRKCTPTLTGNIMVGEKDEAVLASADLNVLGRVIWAGDRC